MCGTDGKRGREKSRAVDAQFWHHHDIPHSSSSLYCMLKRKKKETERGGGGWGRTNCCFRALWKREPLKGTSEKKKNPRTVWATHIKTQNLTERLSLICIKFAFSMIEAPSRKHASNKNNNAPTLAPQCSRQSGATYCCTTTTMTMGILARGLGCVRVWPPELMRCEIYCSMLLFF